MKKLILGLIIGLILGLGGVAHAWQKNQEAKPIYGFDCSDYYYSKDAGDGHPGYDCHGVVYVFDDENNKCYIVKGSNASGISCIKQ